MCLLSLYDCPLTIENLDYQLLVSSDHWWWMTGVKSVVKSFLLYTTTLMQYVNSSSKKSANVTYLQLRSPFSSPDSFCSPHRHRRILSLSGNSKKNIVRHHRSRQKRSFSYFFVNRDLPLHHFSSLLSSSFSWIVVFPSERGDQRINSKSCKTDGMNSSSSAVSSVFLAPKWGR